MGTTFSAGDLAWFETITDLSAGFFGRLVQSGETQLAAVKSQWPKAQATGDAEHLEHLADLGAEASEFVDEAADVALVAMYHWAERSMKNVLVRALHGLQQQHGHVARMNAPVLRQTFEVEVGINLANVSNDRTVNTLRLFANSWKHNAEFADENLCRDLALPLPWAYRSQLAETAIREGMSAKAGLHADSHPGEVVRAYAPATAVFISALANACP